MRPRGGRAVIGGIGLLVGCRVGGASAALLINLLLARTMGMAEMGLALMAMALAAIGAVAASAGLESGSVRYLSAYLATGREAEARGYLRFTGRGVWFAGSAAAALAMATWFALPEAMRPPTALALALPAALLLAATRVSASHCLGFGRPVSAVAPLHLFRPALLMAAIAGIALGPWAMTVPFDATLVMIVFTAAAAASLVVQRVLARRAGGELGPGPTAIGQRVDWLVTGLQLGLAAFFIEFGKDLAILLAGAALPPDDVARLGVVIRIVGMIKFGMVAVNQSFMPQLSGYMALGDDGAVARNIAISNHLKLWPVLVGCTAIYLVREPLLAIFGGGFVAAAPALAILLLEPCLAALLGPGASVVGFSRFKVWILPMTLCAAGVLALGVVLGGRSFGLEGAAAGVVAAWIFWSAALALIARRGLGIDVTAIGSMAWLAREARAVLGRSR